MRIIYEVGDRVTKDGLQGTVLRVSVPPGAKVIYQYTVEWDAPITTESGEDLHLVAEDYDDAEELREAQPAQEGPTRAEQEGQAAVARSFGEPGIKYDPVAREAEKEAESAEAEARVTWNRDFKPADHLGNRNPYGCSFNPCRYHGEW